jgi:hypothetical protein
LEVQPERDQIGVTGATADLGRSLRGGQCVRVVAGHQLLERDGGQQVAVLGALLPLVLEESAGPAEPPARLREVAPRAQVEPQPACAPRGPPMIASLGIQLVGALQRPETVLDVTEEVGRGRQQLQILRGQGSRPVGQRQRGVGIRPRQPLGGLAAPHQRTLRAHRTPASSQRLIHT